MLSDKEFENIIRESIREEIALLKEGKQTLYIWSEDGGRTYGLYDKLTGSKKVPLVKGNEKTMMQLLLKISNAPKSDLEDEFSETAQGDQYGEINVDMNKLAKLKSMVKETSKKKVAEAELEKEKFTDPDQMRMYEAKKISTGDADKFAKALAKNAPEAGVIKAKAAKHNGEIKLFVDYKSHKQRRALADAGKKLGLKYVNDGRSTNRPGLDYKRGDKMVGGKGVLGISKNWMVFIKEGVMTEKLNKSDVKYSMKLAFDNQGGNWYKALKGVEVKGDKIKLSMSSYMGSFGETLQKIVDEFNDIMRTDFKIDKGSFQQGRITSVMLKEGVMNEATVTLGDLKLNAFQTRKFKKHMAKHRIKAIKAKVNSGGHKEITYSAPTERDLVHLFKAAGGYYPDGGANWIEESVNEAFKPGDMWSKDFDYTGMLKFGSKVKINTPLKVLEALYDSFEDVNYHSENAHLGEAISSLLAKKPNEAKKHMNVFNKACLNTLKSVK